MAKGSQNQQTARAGEHYVAAELNRRGAYAVTFAGNMPKIDILASDTDQTRTISIQVKTCRSGSWQTSIKEGKECTEPSDEINFWIFVDIKNPTKPPNYFIVPHWWIRNNIFEVHQDYLSKHGGSRANNPQSNHHSIPLKRIKQWQDRWDILRIF